MAGLANGKVVKVVMITVLLVAQATSQSHTEYVTRDGWETFPLPSSSPALTLIKFSADTNTSNARACFRVRYASGYTPVNENFTIMQDDEERNIIAVRYTNKNTIHKIRDVWNMLTGAKTTLWWSIERVSVWSNQRVRWQVFNNVSASLNTLTADPSASAVNTTLPPTSPSFYRSPTFLTLASLCALLALSTFVLSVLQCQRCASARSGLGQTVSSSDSTTFKSTETLVNRQASFPYNHNGRGSLHISENSLYGVI